MSSNLYKYEEKVEMHTKEFVKKVDILITILVEFQVYNTATNFTKMGYKRHVVSLHKCINEETIKMQVHTLTVWLHSERPKFPSSLQLLYPLFILLKFAL